MDRWYKRKCKREGGGVVGKSEKKVKEKERNVNERKRNTSSKKKEEIGVRDRRKFGLNHYSPFFLLNFRAKKVKHAHILLFTRTPIPA